MAYINLLTTDDLIQRISVDDNNRLEIFYKCFNLLNNIEDEKIIKSDLIAAFNINTNNINKNKIIFEDSEKQIKKIINKIDINSLNNNTKLLIDSIKTLNKKYHNKIRSVLDNWNNIDESNYFEAHVYFMKSIFDINNRNNILWQISNELCNRIDSMVSSQRKLLYIRLQETENKIKDKEEFNQAHSRVIKLINLLYDKM